MKIEDLKGKHIHFIGCGGIGMLGLALLSKEFGMHVSGSDIAESKNTDVLRKNDINVFFNHDEKNLPYIFDSNIDRCDSLIVYSSAVKKDNPELAKAVDDGVLVFKRGVFLGELARGFKKVIAIAGSHGKTTVTAMIAHMINNYGINASFYIGGMPANFKYNAEYRGNEILVTEGDESDLSICHLYPDIGIILNLDDDHAWNVGGAENLHNGFINYAKNSKKVILGSEKIPVDFSKSLIKNAVNLIPKVSIREDLLSPYFGIERENVLTALTVGEQMGLDLEKAIESIKSFSGVERRMTKKYNSKNLTVIEDYAHHPAEIEAVLDLISQKHRDRQKIIVIQPHREQRVKYFFDDFVRVLSDADKVFVLPIFEAWEDAYNSLDDKLVFALKNKGTKLNRNWKESAQVIFNLVSSSDPCVVLILGAGDNYKLTEELLTLL